MSIETYSPVNNVIPILLSIYLYPLNLIPSQEYSLNLNLLPAMSTLILFSSHQCPVNLTRLTAMSTESYSPLSKEQ